MTTDYERACHAMASLVMMTCVLLVISELTKEELVMTPISVRSVLQVLYTPYLPIYRWLPIYSGAQARSPFDDDDDDEKR